MDNERLQGLEARRDELERQLSSPLDKMDRFFNDLPTWVHWLLILAVAVVAIVLEHITKSPTPTLLLAIPGIYIMGRTGGIVLIVKFALYVTLIAFVGAAALNYIPCGGWGEGFRLFYNVRCD